MENPFTLDEQQKRFSTLEGRPVHAGRLRALFHSTSIQAAGVAIAFNAAARPPQDPAQFMFSTAFDILGCMVMHTVLRHFNRQALGRAFKSDQDKLAVDMQPGPGTPPTSPDNMLGASYMIFRSMLMCGMLALTNYLLDTKLISSNGVSVPGVMVYADMIALGLRFRNVQTKKWAITDMPEPQAKKEEKTVLAHAPQATPS